MSSIPFPAALGVADRLALIIAGLRGAVAARMAADRALVPLLTLLWSRLRRMSDRFARLSAGIAPKREPAGGAPRPSGPRDRLPTGRAWLLRLLPEAAAYGAQLQALLSDPAMAALLAAAPRTGRVLRPLCRLLAVPPGPATPYREKEPRREPLGRSVAPVTAPPVAPNPPSPPTPRAPDFYARA